VLDYYHLSGEAYGTIIVLWVGLKLLAILKIRQKFLEKCIIKIFQRPGTLKIFIL